MGKIFGVGMLYLVDYYFIGRMKYRYFYKDLNKFIIYRKNSYEVYFSRNKEDISRKKRIKYEWRMYLYVNCVIKNNF